MWVVHAQLWELIALGCTPLTTSWNYKYYPTWVLYVVNYYLIVAL
jgi:hypothetical protein